VIGGEIDTTRVRYFKNFWERQPLASPPKDDWVGYEVDKNGNKRGKLPCITTDPDGNKGLWCILADSPSSDRSVSFRQALGDPRRTAPIFNNGKDGPSPGPTIDPFSRSKDNCHSDRFCNDPADTGDKGKVGPPDTGTGTATTTTTTTGAAAAAAVAAKPDPLEWVNPYKGAGISFIGRADPLIVYAAAIRSAEAESLALIRDAVDRTTDRFYRENQSGFSATLPVLRGLDDLARALSERSESERRTLDATRLTYLWAERDSLTTLRERVQAELDKPFTYYNRKQLQEIIDRVKLDLEPIDQFLEANPMISDVLLSDEFELIQQSDGADGAHAGYVDALDVYDIASIFAEHRARLSDRLDADLSEQAGLQAERQRLLDAAQLGEIDAEAVRSRVRAIDVRLRWFEWSVPRLRQQIADSDRAEPEIGKAIADARVVADALFEQRRTEALATLAEALGVTPEEAAARAEAATDAWDAARIAGTITGWVDWVVAMHSQSQGEPT